MTKKCIKALLGIKRFCLFDLNALCIRPTSCLAPCPFFVKQIIGRKTQNRGHLRNMVIWSPGQLVTEKSINYIFMFRVMLMRFLTIFTSTMQTRILMKVKSFTLDIPRSCTQALMTAV